MVNIISCGSTLTSEDENTCQRKIHLKITLTTQNIMFLILK